MAADREPGPGADNFEHRPPSAIPGADQFPEQIGPYRILQVIGEGGMGIVYLAEQREPVKRRVALKLIKLGMDSREVLARFAAERQALSMMEHACIARVFDAGTSERGQPYFAMEHVKGIPITDYCDKNNLSLLERIQLFRQVCSGVQHAHMKGVMHRDLKPGNVLVELQDGKPLPKIIDFGLAKAVNHRLVEQTLCTEYGMVIGTPQYMSPEQAGLEGLDVDTRTDVYSLGVLLYELLSGDLPFRSQELRRAGFMEMQRIIRETDPPKPSTRVTTLGDAGADVARHRGIAAGELQRSLRGDLDWIVMKALEKDRTRRYETALELAADLERHLQHEPVQASPPSVPYRLAKFVRRNRLQVAAGGLVFLAVVAGGVVSYVQYLRAEDEKEHAVESETLAVEKERESRLLAARVRNEKLVATAEVIFPPWPEKIPAMQRWLQEADQLLQMRAEVQQAVAAQVPPQDLGAGDDPATQQDPDPRRETWLELTARVKSMQQAQAVREGRQPLEVPTIAATHQESNSAWAWNQLAWERVAPPAHDGASEQRFYWQEEPYGLACALAAVARVRAGDESVRLCDALDTLAWAQLANGRDQDARTTSSEAAAAAPASEQDTFHRYSLRMQQEIERCQADLAAAVTKLAGLEAEVSQPRIWLRETLSDLLGKLEQLASLRGLMVRRMEWAAQVEQLTLRNPKWQEAADAILKADGVVASELYSASRSPYLPIRLKPQLGLVPLGMNPMTRLWEFYDLRSAWDPATGIGSAATLQFPTLDPKTGDVKVDGPTGIIFVLLPGGTFTMGAQSDAPDQPNHDRQPVGNEPTNRTLLAPFFMARHELTQGQWQRLVGGAMPSYFFAGKEAEGFKVTLANPVEQVSWDDCQLWLHRQGLELPTEAQWEYGCRAGTTSIWWTGNTVESLEGCANVLDTFASERQAAWGQGASFSDGHMIHAPVGSFAANAFGLYDTHGNVYEWCRDEKYDYERPARTGDGLRMSPMSRSQKILRGGCCDKLLESKSAFRHWADRAAKAWEIGVRPARALQQ